MKRKLSAILIVGLSALLVGCSEDSAPEPQPEKFKPFTMNVKESPVVVEVAEDSAPEPSSLDTSVFEYARKVDVIDARDINAHMTITVWMSEELTPGLAANHVLNQAYDFIQQDDVVGAETITIGVMHGEQRVFQFTVDVANFIESEDGSYAQDVLDASAVDKISLEVEKFAEAFEWRMGR